MKIRYIIMGLLTLFLMSPIAMMGYVTMLAGDGAFTTVQLSVAWHFFIVGVCGNLIIASTL